MVCSFIIRFLTSLCNLISKKNDLSPFDGYLKHNRILTDEAIQNYGK